MKKEWFVSPFHAFVAFASTLAVTTGKISSLNQNILRRRLDQEKPGDFDRFNALIENISINIDDDMTVSEKVGFINLNLVVDSLTCRDINIGEITTDYSIYAGDFSPKKTIDFNIAFDGIDGACDIEYQYEYGFLKGTGKAEIVTDGNAANTSIEFVTNDENGDFSVISSVTDCVLNIEISDMNFIDADFASNVVGLFEKYLRDLIEKEIEGYACSQLSETGTSSLNDDFFTTINDLLIALSTSEDMGAADEISLQSDGFYDVTQALNFREIAETQIGDLFEIALNQIDQLMGSENNNDNELGINNLLRSYILNENGAFVINITDLLGSDASNFEFHDKLTETLITLDEVRISGLDSMTKFDPFVVVGDHTLRNEFSWYSLSVEIDIVLNIKPSSLEDAVLKLDGDSEPKSIIEKMTVEIGAENVDVVASLFALIDVEALGSFTIGSLLSSTNTEDYTWLLTCFMSAIQELRFVELAVWPQRINVPTLEGFIDDGLDRIISDVAEIAFEMYHDLMVEDIIPIMIQNTVKTFVNNQLAVIVENSSSNFDACPKYDGVTAGFVDFRELFASRITTTSNNEYGELPSILWDLIDRVLLEVNPTTGMPKLNEILIQTITKQQSGTEGKLVFGSDYEDIFNIVQRINVGGFDANVLFSGSNIRIENLDTVVMPMVLLEPVTTEPHFLNNSVTVGVEDRPLKLGLTFASSMRDEVEGVEISNNFEISVDMHTVSVLATMMLKVAKSKFLGFPLIDLFNLNCWIATIDPPTLNEFGVSDEDDESNAAMIDFAATVANVNLNVSCLECSSPGIVELSKLLTSSDEAQNDVTSLVNTLLLFTSDVIKGDFVQVQIDRLLNDASKLCRHSPNYDPNFTKGGASLNTPQYSDFDAIEIEGSITHLIIVGLVSLALISVVAVVVFFIHRFTRLRHSRWLATLAPEQVEALKYVQHIDASLDSSLNSTTCSMFQSGNDIPCILRWGMPFVILGNIALFLSGHLNLGATVNIEATFAGETIKVDQFFEFSMAKSTIDIWNAGGRGLAILILLFSGIWPYTKQFVTLVLWFAPTSWVPVSRRGSILVWLDWMAKWSMIDIFVLIISLAAFRVSVKSPIDLAFLPKDFYSLDLLVVPLWGLYANMIAQLVSQISSHLIIHYHRKIAKRASDSYSQNSTNHELKTKEEFDQKLLLRNHRFGRPRRGGEEKLIVKVWTNYILISLVFSAIACIITGCILPAFSIEIFGLFGVAVESGQDFEDAKTHHSIFTVINLLFEQAQFLKIAKNFVGLGSFSVIFALTVLLVPILQSLALIGHWFVPMTIKQITTMSVLVEILQAWQYAEVYIIAIFVASWQLGPISSFMVNSYCGSLDSFFSELVFYGILKNEDAQCFSIKSSIEEGFYILAIGSVLLALINAFVTKAAKQCQRDQDETKRQSQVQEHFFTSKCDNEVQELNDNHPESTIYPPPVLFTDIFRWFLTHHDKSKTHAEDLSYDE